MVRVIDGDTILVLRANSEQVKIRLEGIDCPDYKQDFGTRAKFTTSDLCFGKQVKVRPSGFDRSIRLGGVSQRHCIIHPFHRSLVLSSHNRAQSPLN